MACRFCGRYFTEGTCIICGEYCYDIVPGVGQCKKCYDAKQACRYIDIPKPAPKRRPRKIYNDGKSYSMRAYERRTKAADERYEAWIKRLTSIQTHTLTEDEWLRACSYFGGCALCGSESIDTRGYFIRFKDGGRYNACNIIPLCESCATSVKRQPNLFRQMNPAINRNLAVSKGLTLARLENTAKYLQNIMEVIENEQ